MIDYDTVEPTSDASDNPPRQRRRTETDEPTPYSRMELRGALARPDRAMEIAVGGRERLAATLSRADHLGWLTALLLSVSVAAALPYGWIAPLPPPTAAAEALWSDAFVTGGPLRVAMLYTGSLLLCFPCLHVFAQFLGFRFRLGQNFALALLIPSVAATFSFGFAPIMWFIDVTTASATVSRIEPRGLSAALLVMSLSMGVIQLVRCMLARTGLGTGVLSPFGGLVTVWTLLLLFITSRMANLLELW